MSCSAFGKNNEYICGTFAIMIAKKLTCHFIVRDELFIRFVQSNLKLYPSIFSKF